MLEANTNHNYKVEQQGQVLVQNKPRLKLCEPCPEGLGQALLHVNPTNNQRGEATPSLEDRKKKSTLTSYTTAAREDATQASDS